MLLKNLEQQKACYGVLQQLLELQKRAIKERDDEALMAAIKDKNVQIQTLHRLEQEFNRLIGELNGEQKESAEQQTQSLRQEIVRALESLIEAENACQHALIQETEELKQQMVEFKKKKNLFKGYNDPSSSKGGGFSGNV